jgi:MFS family permease
MDNLSLKRVRKLIGDQKDFYKLTFTMSFAFIQGSTVFVLLPLFFQQLRLSPTEIGLLMSASGFGGIFGGVLAGKLSDMIGRKPVIYIGLLGYAIPWIIYLFFKSTSLFYLARIIDGITLQMFLTAVYAYIADVFPPEKRGGAMGIFRSFANLGMTIGPILLVGLVYNIFGAEAYFIISASIFLVCGLCVLFFVKESKQDLTKSNSFVERLKRPNKNSGSSFKVSLPVISQPLIIFTISAIFRAIGQSMIISILSIYLSERGLSITEISLLYSITSILNIFIPTLFGKLSDRFGRKKLLTLGIILSGIASLQYLWVNTLTHFLGVRLLEAVAVSITMPVGLAFLTELLPASQRGLGIGVYSIFTSPGMMGVLGGAIVQNFGFNMIFPVAFASSIVSAGILVFGLPEKK